MTAVLDAPAASPPRQSLQVRNDVNMLRGVTWEEYLRYRETPENKGVRMYYADGDLLLMSTGPLHERISALLRLLFWTYAEDRDIPIMTFGRWTMREDLEKKGLEPDDCYYVRSIAEIEGRNDLAAGDEAPPPDVALEVDLTTHSRHKFSIYASLGVAEIWVWERNAIAVYRLVGKEYQRVDASLELEGFPFAAAAAIVLQRHMDDDNSIRRAFREVIG